MAGVYLVHGDDAYALNDARKKLEAKFLDPAWAAFNLVELPGDAPVRALLEAVLAMPFGAGHRLVVMREPAFLLGKSEDPAVAELEKLLERGLPEGSALLFMLAKLDQRLKLVKKVVETATVRELAQPKPWNTEESMRPWLEREVGQRGRSIAPDALGALIAAVGADRYRASQEVEKLTTYVAEGGRISAADVRALVPGGEVEVFALTDALARRDPGEALVALERLLVGEHLLKVTAAIVTIMRGWWKLKLHAESGLPPVAIAREIGARSDFKVKKDLEQIRAWKAAQLERALGELAEVDEAVKTGRWPPEHHGLLMQRAIARMLG